MTDRTMGVMMRHMVELKLEAPLSNKDGFEPCSLHEQLALALGKMTGAMLPDGAWIDMASDTMSNIAIQAILSEMGMKQIVFGSAASNDEKSMFVAMSDGSIVRFSATVDGGKLVYKTNPTVKEELLKDCSIVQEYTNGINGIVGQALNVAGLAEVGDNVNGHIIVDVHAAICMRVCARGNYLVSEGTSMKIRGGFYVTIDCPIPNAEPDTIVSYMTVRELSEQEIKDEQELQRKAVGITSPFPVKYGEA